MTTKTPTVTHIPGDSRGHTDIGWLDSRHSFSFGQYHDPNRMAFRSLRVLNDDRVVPGAGFGEHPHRDMEILTWVLDGALKHGDSIGNLKELRPGELQAMTAGTGIVHSELNASDTDPVHFIQVWIEPRAGGVQPRYDQKAFDAEGRVNRWQTVASGRDADGALPIDQDAEFRVADVAAGASVEVHVDADRYGYLHVATGSVTVGDQTLQAGDALTIEGGADLTLTGVSDAQLLGFDLA
ncbi:MAG: pirin family protein [Planctomycetota bacterium]